MFFAADAEQLVFRAAESAFRRSRDPHLCTPLSRGILNPTAPSLATNLLLRNPRRHCGGERSSTEIRFQCDGGRLKLEVLGLRARPLVRRFAACI